MSYRPEINAERPRRSLGDRLARTLHHLRLPRGQTRLLDLLRRLRGKQTVIAPVGRGLLMELHPSDALQYDLLRHGAYEAGTLALLDRLLPAADSFWDFGAHMGLYTLPAARVLQPLGRPVVSIEPNPAHAHQLARNLLLNGLGNVRICTAAADEAFGLESMITPDADNTGGSRLGTYIRPDSRALGLSVPTVPASVLAQKLGMTARSLVKIDVEGREFTLLASLFQHVCPDDLIIEFFRDNHAPEAAAAGLAACRARGYRLLDIHGNPWDETTRPAENNLWLTRSGA